MDFETARAVTITVASVGITLLTALVGYAIVTTEEPETEFDSELSGNHAQVVLIVLLALTGWADIYAVTTSIPQVIVALSK